MRFSNLLNKTRKEIPSDVQSRSHELLIRGGFIHQLSTGIFSYLPLALRSLRKIEDILRKEMEEINGQEVNMPLVQSADIWKETGRWSKIGSEMTRFYDRKGHDMVLAMTHEEAATDLMRPIINSYKQFPLTIYQIQTKWRDDARPRAGLIRVREFVMKDSYSFDKTQEGLEKQYQSHYQAYFKMFNRCGLPVKAVLADTGMMGGAISHEYMYLSEIGEDTILICSSCDYSANRQIAKAQKPEKRNEDFKPLEEIHTPNCKTIDEVSSLLKVKSSRMAKSIFMVALTQEDKEELILAVIPGDHELNETSLTNLLKARDLRPATIEEIEEVGSVAGYASPLGLKNIKIIADTIITEQQNWITGANKKDYHVLNFNYERDFKADIVADIIAVQEGDLCLKCSSPLTEKKAIEVGNIFQLGTFYSEKMNLFFQDEDGKQRPVIMGSYGIGVGRLLGSIIEEHNDENGIIWPITVSPYSVHLVLLEDKNSTEIQRKAEEIYNDLKDANIDTLFDDREGIRPGIKFNDADLIGIPIRLTVSKRSLESQSVELSIRGKETKELYPIEEIINKVHLSIEKLLEELKV